MRARIMTPLDKAGRPGAGALSEKFTAIAETQRLIEAIDCSRLHGLRDRAIIALIGLAGASIPAVITMRVQDFYRLAGRSWIRFVEEGKQRDVLLSRETQRYIDEYLAAAGAAYKGTDWLFRTALPGARRLSHRAISREYMIKIIRQLMHHKTVDRSKGKIWQQREADSLDNIDAKTAHGVRLRAILGLMLYASASPGAIAALCVRDYYVEGDQHWIRLGNRPPIVAIPPLVELMREYLGKARIGDEKTKPLFGRQNRAMTPRAVRLLVRRGNSQRTTEQA